MTKLILFGVVAVVGAVVFYFFLRANPKKKAAIDEAVNKIKPQK